MGREQGEHWKSQFLLLSLPLTQFAGQLHILARLCLLDLCSVNNPHDTNFQVILGANIAAHQVAADSHQAVVASNQARGRYVVGLLADRHVGALTDSVVMELGVRTTERDVMISAGGQQHIIIRRQISSRADVELAAYRLSECLSDLRYWLQPKRNPTTFELIGFVASAKRYVLIALKFIPSAKSRSHLDEWWVKTAIPFGKERFKTEQRLGNLRVLP